MGNKLFGALFVAFLPGIVLAIAGAVFTVRKYGVFLWYLRPDPMREKLVSMLRDMHSPAPVVVRAQIARHEARTAIRVRASRDRSAPLPSAQRWLG